MALSQWSAGEKCQKVYIKNLGPLLLGQGKGVYGTPSVVRNVVLEDKNSPTVSILARWQLQKFTVKNDIIKRIYLGIPSIFLQISSNTENSDSL